MKTVLQWRTVPVYSTRLDLKETQRSPMLTFSFTFVIDTGETYKVVIENATLRSIKGGQACKNRIKRAYRPNGRFKAFCSDVWTSCAERTLPIETVCLSRQSPKQVTGQHDPWKHTNLLMVEHLQSCPLAKSIPSSTEVSIRRSNFHYLRQRVTVQLEKFRDMDSKDPPPPSCSCTSGNHTTENLMDLQS